MITCDRCGAQLGHILRDAACYLTESGVVIAGEDRAISPARPINRPTVEVGVGGVDATPPSGWPGLPLRDLGVDPVIHRCPTVTREDEAKALRHCGQMLAEQRARHSPTIDYR